MIKEHKKMPFFGTALFVGTAEDRSALYVGRSQLSRSQYSHRQPQADQVAHDADKRESEELRGLWPNCRDNQVQIYAGPFGIR